MRPSSPVAPVTPATQPSLPAVPKERSKYADEEESYDDFGESDAPVRDQVAYLPEPSYRTLRWLAWSHRRGRLVMKPTMRTLDWRRIALSRYAAIRVFGSIHSDRVVRLSSGKTFKLYQPYGYLREKEEKKKKKIGILNSTALMKG